MKKAALFALAWLAVAALAGPVAAQQLPAAKVPAGESQTPLPRLILEAPVFEAGDVRPGSEVTHEFTFKNEGRADLVIEGVQAGCACLVSSFEPTIAPGETGRITLTLKVYPEWAGQTLRRTAWLLTNDPLSPQVRLVVGARILPETPAPDAGQ